MSKKQEIIAFLEKNRPDDYERAKRAFGFLTEEGLDSPYGDSGQTPRQILHAYKAHADKYDGWIEYLKQIKE